MPQQYKPTLVFLFLNNAIRPVQKPAHGANTVIVQIFTSPEAPFMEKKINGSQHFPKLCGWLNSFFSHFKPVATLSRNTLCHPLVY